MKLLPLAAACATLLIAAMPLSSPVSAATGLQRCASADGTVTYTDRPCAALGATAVGLPGELLSRIARDQRRHDTALGGASLSRDDSFADTNASASVPARRAATGGCARSTTQLVMDLQGAMALGDVNRLAESYHWVGLSSSQGQQIMRRLDSIAEQPLLHADYFNAQMSGGLQFADASGATLGGSAGMLQMMLGESGTSSVVDFDVEKYRGCYFVRF